MRTVLIVIVGVVFGAWFLRSDSDSRNEAEKNALEDLNLQLTGVVESIQEGDNFHSYGIIRLRIISSNVQDYDARGKLPYYFCTIKGNMAEVYQHVSKLRTFVGDTLTYDTKKKLGARVKNGRKTEEGSISVSRVDDYYRFIERETIFK